MDKVLVLGGGVIGLSIAATLAINNYAVTVVASDAAEGKFASGTPAGILMPWDGEKKHEKRIAAFNLWRSWSSTIEKLSSLTIDYQEIGTLRIKACKSPTLKGEGDWSTLKNRGIALGNDIGEHSSLLLPGATITTTKLLSALRNIINNLGGSIISDSIVSMHFSRFSANSVKGKSGKEYLADTFILAAGLGTSAFLSDLGINETIIGDGGEVLQVSSPRPPPSLLYLDDFIIVPKLDGSSWVAGIHRKFEKEPAFVKEDEAQLLAIAKKALGESTTKIGQWAGVRPKVMNKGEAILQRAPLAKNVIVAAGHSSNGILLSPLVAQEILELVANG